MTLSPVHALTPGQQKPDAPVAATAEQRQVAQQFEAIFMRQLLGSMEKSGSLGGDTSGAGVYRSMMVGALADSAASGGGIGLAELVLKAMVAAEPAVGQAAAVSHDATIDTAATPGAAPDVTARTAVNPIK